MAYRRWILTADEKVARLLCMTCSGPEGRRVRVDDEIHDPWIDHEHARPSPRRGRSGHTHASPGHARETRRVRFAKEIAVWVQQRVEALGVDRLVVFAAPRMLGALREAWPSRVAMLVYEHDDDLTHLDPESLIRHASVVKAIEGMG